GLLGVGPFDVDGGGEGGDADEGRNGRRGHRPRERPDAEECEGECGSGGGGGPPAAALRGLLGGARGEVEGGGKGGFVACGPGEAGGDVHEADVILARVGRGAENFLEAREVGVDDAAVGGTAGEVGE